jgi:uncharacterized protein (TIGR02646 family)
MRQITKGPEPPSLIAHRQTPLSNYQNYEEKDDLRHALITEQAGLCCYCMGRIHDGPTTMRIEHWQCRHFHSAEQLNYRNLLGACLGGGDQPQQDQHCDRRKGDLDLQWNPADPTHHVETRVRYELDGSIKSDEPEFDAQLNEVLNLNLPLLKNNRKGILSGIIEWWKHRKARLQGPVPRLEFERKRDRCVAGDGQLSPYCQVEVWWIEQRLLKMER